MNYTIESIADFCGGESHIIFPGSVVSRIIIDHRSPMRDNALFVALKGARFDGHDFIPEMLEFKVRHFMVSDPSVVKKHEGRANFILVSDPIKSLQMIAAEHRENFNTPVIAITGSNGKTIVKEWLNTLLEERFTICRSPRSFNSQLGVPLSVFELTPDDTLAIFEAGISMPGEMVKLERMLKPQVGIFTNLGDAHSAHFQSDEDKFKEKWSLFKGADQIICCADQAWQKWLPETAQSRCVTWSRLDQTANVFISTQEISKTGTRLRAIANGETHQFEIAFTDRASIENAIHCFTALWVLGATDWQTMQRFELLTPVAMRMEVKQGIEDTLIIDDTYNADLDSLRASIDQLMTHENREKWVILSDLKETNSDSESYKQIAAMLIQAGVSRIIGIGQTMAEHAKYFEPLKVQCFDSAEQYWRQLDTSSLKGKAILIKGARRFRLEKLVSRLQAKQHITTLEIDLHKLRGNLDYFKRRLNKKTKIMAMVKAFAYGSGSFEIAHFFQSQKAADYLVVAYPDEGVELRDKGITLPIMVMSPARISYETLIQYRLEPEIYSLQSLENFIKAARSMRHFFDEFAIHLKIDSGMHRLGFEEQDLPEAMKILQQSGFIKVASVFTHLSAADDQLQDDFTNLQIARFNKANTLIAEHLGYQPNRHVLNSAGALRFDAYQYEMVRLGIGLYGFDNGPHAKFLSALATLRSYIVQVRTVAPGESVGYARQGIADKKRSIATVAIGYSDGLDRRLGNGNWSLIWQGKPCATVGNICMDMTMIDVTDTNAKEGDEVIVFQGNDSIKRMAEILNTIPYEILTKIPERVRRIYLQE